MMVRLVEMYGASYMIDLFFFFISFAVKRDWLYRLYSLSSIICVISIYIFRVEKNLTSLDKIFTMYLP